MTAFVARSRITEHQGAGHESCRHGVLRFADQRLDLASLKRFSELFG